MIVKCPRCPSAVTKVGTKYCNICGAKMEALPVCERCKTPVKPFDKFCEQCGRPLI